MSFLLSRRAMLRGLGVAVGLPFLESMIGPHSARASGVTPPSRYVFMGSGLSSGPDADKGPAAPTGARGWSIPMNTGAGYDLPPGLTPLAPVKDDVTIVSNMKSSGLPSIFVDPGFAAHVLFSTAVFSGRSPIADATQLGPYQSYRPAGPTSDILVAADIAGTTPYSSLAVQIDTSIDGGGTFPVDVFLSHRIPAGGTLVVPNTPVQSPRQLFQSLFGAYAPGLTEVERARQVLEQDKRKFVVDRVLANASTLRGRLGAADRKRLDAHLENLYELQKRVVAVPPKFDGVCALPGDPGDDPSATGPQEYRGERERAVAFVNLLHMALACDLTRVVSVQITNGGNSALNLFPITSYDLPLHGSGVLHSGNDPELLQWQRFAATQRWVVGVFVALVEKLKATSDGNGTMLDNTAVVYASDAGYPWPGPPTIPAGETFGSHSPRNVMMMVAGKAGGLRSGIHIDGNEAHPSSFIFTAMKAAGFKGAAFGAMSTEIPGMRVPV